MSLQDQLIMIQGELKAPKGRTNDFGGFKYRSCDDIMAAVKPILEKAVCTLILSDEVVLIGDRYYVKATATLKHADIEVSTFGYAREVLSKTKMDECQITGSASSYARKYALNGLFLIDDAIDPDSQEPEKEDKKPKLLPLPQKNHYIDTWKKWIDEQFSLGFSAVAKDRIAKFKPEQSLKDYYNTKIKETK